MSEEQKQMFDVRFMDLTNSLSKEIPTQEQLTKWANTKAYGIWIDDKGRINNKDLTKYKPSDFSSYDVSKLYGAAIGKDGHTVQVDLRTNQYYEKLAAQRKRKPYCLLWSCGKLHMQHIKTLIYLPKFFYVYIQCNHKSKLEH